MIALHAEVEAHIVANVARSEDEAERQARGEDVTLAGAGEAEEEAGRRRQRTKRPPRKTTTTPPRRRKPRNPDGMPTA